MFSRLRRPLLSSSIIRATLQDLGSLSFRCVRSLASTPQPTRDASQLGLRHPYRSRTPFLKGEPKLDFGINATVLGCSSTWIMISSDETVHPSFSGDPTEILMILPERSSLTDGVVETRFSPTLLSGCECFPLLRRISLVQDVSSNGYEDTPCNSSRCWLLESTAISPEDTFVGTDLESLGLISIQHREWETILSNICPIGKTTGRKAQSNGCKDKW